jgi:cyanophycinase
MARRRAFKIVAAAVLAVAVSGAIAQDAPPTFVGVGGALKDDNEAVFRALLARNQTGTIVIVPYASADTEGAVKSSIERFRKYRPEARCLMMPDPSNGPEEKRQAAEMVGKADLVWFSGGDQSRLIPRFYDGDTPNAVLIALREAAAKGTVVGGTSAGCACLSHPMFTGGGSEAALGGKAIKAKEGAKDEDEQTPAKPASDGPQIGTGLGLVPDVILDSHFAQRGRIGRMVAALEKSGLRFGIGVNENRAVAVRERVFRGIGDGAALVVDIGELARDGLSRRGVRVSLLGDGASCTILPAGAPHRVAYATASAASGPGQESDELLRDLPPAGGAWEKGTIPNLMRRLAAHPAAPQHAMSEQFEVVLSADERTRFSWGPHKPESLTVFDARMDILERVPGRESTGPAARPPGSP